MIYVDIIKLNFPLTWGQNFLTTIEQWVHMPQQHTCWRALQTLHIQDKL